MSPRSYLRPRPDLKALSGPLRPLGASVILWAVPLGILAGLLGAGLVVLVGWAKARATRETRTAGWLFTPTLTLGALVVIVAGRGLGAVVGRPGDRVRPDRRGDAGLGGHAEPDCRHHSRRRAHPQRARSPRADRPRSRRADRRLPVPRAGLPLHRRRLVAGRPRLE
ncbi:MAG: hypothetical protein M0Z42_11060 [Actinomycetota bacterium]|nr:hypothetical protein [Actinomycetota bacterium]